MKNIAKLLILPLIIVVLHSCERQKLMEDCICTTKAAIPIHIDWEASGVTPKNVTVLLYNKSDGSLAQEHMFQHNDADIQSYIYVPMGEYTVVVFNELRGQIEYVDVEDHESLLTLKFVSETNNSAIARSSTLDYVQQPGGLAVQIVEDFEVTKEVILYTATMGDSVTDDDTSKSTDEDVSRSTSTALMNIETEQKTCWLTITAHFKNLNYARMPSLVDLSNIANGYYVGSDKNTLDPARMQFTMNNRTYDEGSDSEGTISTTVALFGTLGDRLSTSDHTDETPITIDILFMQIDEEQSLVNYSQDVTDLIEFGDDGLNLTIDIDFSDPLPVVTPEGWEDSGFSTGLEDWTVVEVPLING
ncbi:MAG: DUF5119 domain-containing protein [Rikenellaceae bacterium]